MLLAIDPGTKCLGWAVIRPDKTLAASGVFKPTGVTVWTKIRKAQEFLTQLGSAWPITQVVTEATEQVHRIQRTETIEGLGTVHKMLEDLADGWGCEPPRRYNPSQIKLAATGLGAANKDAVIHAMRGKWGKASLVSDDEADALAIAWTAIAFRHWPQKEG